MKSSKALVVSLLVNILALGALAALGLRSPETESDPAPASAPPAPAPREKPQSEPAPETPAVTEAFHWSQVESEDYREYVANLRRIGCPEQTIRDIITADIGNLYTGRHAEILAANRTETPYWKPRKSASRSGSSISAKLKELTNERRQLLQQILGDPPPKPSVTAAAASASSRYSYIAPEKRSDLSSVIGKYTTLEREVLTAANGRLQPEDREKITQLRTEKRNELSQLLSPTEMTDWLARHHSSARRLREDLIAFQPSENEFKQIVSLQSGFEDQFGTYVSSTDKEKLNRSVAAKREMEAELQSILGEQRFQEYKLSQDYKYRELYRLSERHELPPNTVATVWEIKQAAENQAAEIRRDTAMSAEQQNQLSATIQQEAQKAVQDALGREVYESYTKQTAGSWLDRLNRGDAREQLERLRKMQELMKR